MILSDLAIKNRIAVFSAMVFLAIAGTFCYINLPRENFPDITVPFVFVSTRYQGVAPQEIENLITIHMEKKMKGLDKVKEISSSSVEEFSNITIEFFPDQDIDSAVQKVKDKVDLAREDMPDDIDEPIVSEINLSTDIPIMSIAFYGTDSLALLKKTVEDIRDKIETIPGVLEAGIFGDRKREIRVEVDIKRLNSYGIPAVKLIQLLTRENSTVSAGTLDMLGTKFQIRIPGEFARPDEINSLIVSRSSNGMPIYLTDFSKISDTYKDLETISRVGTVPCISLMIQKRSGANIIKVIKEIKKVLDSESRKMSSGIKWKITSDLSKDTYQMIYELENNIVSGLILVLAVLFFAMGLRNSFFVALAIPLSMMIAFMVMSLQGITLNMMVLFSLILSLGMLVDNGIVIVENIYRHRCSGMSALEASKIGASEVAWPVITSTLTTTVAFIPLLYWPDVIGKFMAFLPKTVILTLSASLFVGIIINPAICSVMIKPAEKKSLRSIFRATDWIGEKISTLYYKSLRTCLEHPYVTNLTGIMIFIFTVMLFARYGAGVELFPNSDPRRTTIQVKFPEGTEITKTDTLLKEIEKRIRKYEDITYTLTTVGRGAGNFFKGGESGPYLGSIQIEFKDFDKRKYSSTTLANAIRMNVTGLENIHLRKSQKFGNLIEVRYPGKDAESLKILLEEALAYENLAVPVKIDPTDNPDEAPSITVAAGENTDRIIAMLANETMSFPGAEIIVKNEQEGPQTGAPISIEVSGDDFEILSQLAEKIKSEIKNIPGLADLRDDYEEARPELKFTVDRTRAALLGLDTGTIADFIRTAINGLEVTKYREGEEEYDITIRLPEEQRIDSKALFNMQIPIPGHSPVALSSLGKFEYARGYGTIRRKNYDRTITLDADAKP
ncbi:MAG: efflux RND transporter permease subunit, partial [Candidatus Nanoarchaeia archaeon]